MATFGGIACTFIHNQGVANLRQRIEMWVVPGVDNVGSRKLGASDSQWAFELVLYGSSANVEAWYSAICNLQGTVITIVDDWGTTYAANMLVAQIGPLMKQARVNTDSLGTCIGRCQASGVVMRG